jgi:hypothetical protein
VRRLSDEAGAGAEVEDALAIADRRLGHEVDGGRGEARRVDRLVRLGHAVVGSPVRHRSKEPTGGSSQAARDGFADRLSPHMSGGAR